MQFVGFESKPTVREYTFTVREASGESREFTLTISHESFKAYRARYQDAPDICSHKLRRELANHPSETHFHISDTDLDDYRATHAAGTAKSPFARKPARDF